MQRSVLRDADHREDLLKMRAEAERVNGLATFFGRDHQLDDERDAAGVQVFDFRKIEQDALDAVGQAFVRSDDGRLGGAGDVARKPHDGDRFAAGGG